MKIEIKLGVSQQNGVQSVSLEDLGITKDEWDAYNDYEKNEYLQDYINNLLEQPYWCVDSFIEHKK